MSDTVKMAQSMWLAGQGGVQIILVEDGDLEIIDHKDNQILTLSLAGIEFEDLGRMCEWVAERMERRGRTD